jgi:hypothetical protein
MDITDSKQGSILTCLQWSFCQDASHTFALQSSDAVRLEMLVAVVGAEEHFLTDVTLVRALQLAYNGIQHTTLQDNLRNYIHSHATCGTYFLKNKTSITKHARRSVPNNPDCLILTALPDNTHTRITAAWSATVNRFYIIHTHVHS